MSGNVNHPGLASVYESLSVVRRYQGHAKDALDLLEKSLAINQANYGDTHKNVGLNYNGIGRAYLMLDNVEKAEEHFRKALTILEQTCGENHHLVGVCLSNLGEVSAMKGQYLEAISMLARSMDIDANKNLYDDDLMKLGALMKQCMESAQKAKLQDLPQITEKYEQAKSNYPQYFQSNSN